LARLIDLQTFLIMLWEVLMPEETGAPEALEFRAEVQQLLNILAHSLYTEREIFLREVISNASDALHRLQFEMLTNREVFDPDEPLAIHIDFDNEAHTLTVSDSGIGMTHDELIENLGTIAHSGAMAFMKGLEEGQRPADIIGQFGVGFYAVFMVADEVIVTSRSYRPDAQAWRWISDGGSQFTLAPAEREHRGTTVEIKLRDGGGADAGEFASAWRLEQIVKRHSNYVSFPIYVKDRIANQQSALWRKPQKDVQAGEYDEFYRQLTLDSEAPLTYVHIITDAPVDIRSILYVPRALERTPLATRSEFGLQLYSRKILIQEHSKDLLPDYLRFVEGVVDSEDIPLNISRETVQSNRMMQQIQKVLASRLLKALRQLADEKPDDYRVFWEQFGPFIKQGVAISPGERSDLVPLLRFVTNQSDGKLVALADYAGRMSQDQKAIYYMLGSDRASAEHSPHLDPFRVRGLEVLFLLDPFDGLTMQNLHEYEGKPLQNVDDPQLELPAAPPPEKPAEGEAPPPDLALLIARAKEVLGARVSDVRETQLLTDSPCRLVSTAGGFDRDLQRMRRILEQDFVLPAKILELNPRHPLVRNLARLVAERPEDTVIAPAIEQLYENQLLLEGLHPNPADMVPRLQQLLEAATRQS
jgi:molecular chaperone HtpG